ncbi:ATP-binding protein [Sphingomonas sp. BIUV-7]|uniref:histidine kinase n=1 Tax=Sphingomonas natans TaxID=3063330 RepID=A0ABT8Y6J5_9SPHN|nr:GAF domain-containing protein [Sphingomonas sp. BIUV-7]MDO6413949.1 ATP-binding protein [Sphingomonas sp. BIUV-7]
MKDRPVSQPALTEADRLAALAAARILDTPPEPRFDDIVALVSSLCEVPIALVSLVDAHRQWFKAKVGVDACETPIATSVCALAIRQDGLFQIEDLAADPRTRDFALVTDAPHIRFYAGFPIVGLHGQPLGSLCAIDVAPRAGGLNARQALALEALARQVAREIDLGMLPGAPGGDSRSIGTWDWDIQADRVTADPPFADLYGVDRAVAREGAPIAEFMAHIHPADLPATGEAIEQALRTGGPFHAEYRLVRPDGRSRWVAAQGQVLLSPDGVPLRFPGVSFDIDARKTSELRLAALVELNDRLRESGEAADLAYAAAEILGRTLGVSRAGYGTIDPVAETIVVERDWNAPGIQTLAGTLEFRDYGSYIDNLKRGETVAVSDAYADPRTRDTADALKAISAQSFINMPLTEQGGFVALLYLNHEAARPWPAEELAFVRDVAERTRDAVERRRAEQELADLNASLEEQVEARTQELMTAEEHLRQAQKMEAVGQLTGGLAHDFNNLLTGISGAIEMMQIRVTQGRFGELDRYVGAAQGAARRAAALTHRLLAFSRRQTLDPKPVAVDRLISGIEELVRRTVGPAIHVEVVGTPGLWPALVDANQLENAILNLCINARDAMPDGGRITIETANKWLDQRAARERDLEPGQYLSLCVTDTGTGMTPQVQARAFDPFYTTKPLGQGTGLGLSMIYGFARQSGGQVRIYSELETGTTVCIYLPRHHGDAVPDEPLTAQSDIEGEGASADARTVLIVDDEPTVRMLVVEVLEELGHTPLEAGDGAAALRILQSGARIDLLITDVGLPGQMNGRQVADAALALSPELRVLFITGYAENAVIGSRQLDPNMALLTKPFAMDALASRVREMLA